MDANTRPDLCARGPEPLNTLYDDHLRPAFGFLGIPPNIGHPSLFTVEQCQSVRGLFAGGHAKTYSCATRNRRLFWL